ncbi:MAG: ATP phosphoribosyltransferase regulatory subunit [Clostridiales bacterium]|jgi:ATP phosphoribosyltransferase regulatory subunit|nr:ATP phosphoribosyltransferase regulatory subunit [Clostridiales bacterium]
MRDNKMHTPNGFKDFLPGGYSFKQELERKIEDVFQRSCFASVSSPMLEFMEVFEGKGSTDPKQMYRFIDRDGDILTLRSDMTPPIARMAATNYSWDDAPLRFCYTENAFRCHESYKGKAGEFTESGVELIGVSSVDSDAEVVSLAIECLLAAGLKSFRIDIGHTGFFKGILEESALSKEDQDLIMNCLANRNAVAAERIARGKDIPESAKALFSRPHALMGDSFMLEGLKSLTASRNALEAIERLQSINEILTDYGLSQYALFDLGMTGHLNYYTGMLFRGYTQGTGFSVLDGGRYDNLIELYGIPFPSVGFAIKIDNLASVLGGRNDREQSRKDSTLLAYAAPGRKNALEACRELRRQGLKVELSHAGAGDDYIPHMEYAKRKGIPGLLFFDGLDQVLVADLQADSMRRIPIAELSERK